MGEFKLIAHGGIWDSERIAKCIALGSNGVGIGTGFLISMGCTLVQDCYTNTCPAGLTGSYEKLNIQSSVKRIVNYIKGTRIELQNIVGSLGKNRIRDLNKEDLFATDEISNLVSGLSTNDTNYHNKIKSKNITDTRMYRRLIKMNIKEKFIIRSSILELAETGLPRNVSIDDKIRLEQKNGDEPKTEDLWNCITALGAQLSRPPYDPYREIINLDISIGRRQCPNKVILSMPLIIYDNDMQIDETTLESLHVALNRLKNFNTNLGLISENRIKNRNYPHFRRLNERTAVLEERREEDDYGTDGLVFQCNDEKSLQFLTDIRKEFNGPILVEVDNSFEKFLGPLLDAGADGIIANTIKITNKSKYKEMHAIKVIHDIRCAIDQICWKGK